ASIANDSHDVAGVRVAESVSPGAGDVVERPLERPIRVGGSTVVHEDRPAVNRHSNVRHAYGDRPLATERDNRAVAGSAVEEPIASNEERINAVGQLGRDLLGGVPRVDQDVEVASSDHAGSGKLKSLRTIGAVGDRDDLPHLIRLAGWRGSSARGKTAAV